MLTKVIEARYIRGYQVELTFNDGLKEVVDLGTHLKGPVFTSLRDPELFAKFSLNRWTVEWENGADFAPEFLHELALTQRKKKTRSISN